MLEPNQTEDKNVSVILPAYNEEGNIGIAIQKAAKALKDSGYPGEVLVINDGSTDGTRQEAEIAGRRHTNVRIIDHKRNRGLTDALLTGFRNAGGEIIIFLCADLQSDPEEDIPKLLNEIKKGYDVVVGWRQNRKENKIFLSQIYNFICGKLFKLRLHDMNWIKAFKREVIEDMELKSDWHRFIIMLAAYRGYKIGEVKTNWYPRKKGKSKFGFSRIHIAFLDLLAIKFLLIFIDNPIRLFGSLGILLIVLGSLSFIYLILLWFVWHIQLRPVMLLSLFSTLIGVFILMMGFLAELISMQHIKLKRIEQQLKR